MSCNKWCRELSSVFSLYKTVQMHGIEFEKDSKGTIRGYKSHSISEEILDN